LFVKRPRENKGPIAKLEPERRSRKRGALAVD